MPSEGDPVTPGGDPTTSEGDPRVLFVMNVVLSFVFSTIVVWGLSVIDVTAFEWTNVAAATLFPVVLTYLAVLR